MQHLSIMFDSPQVKQDLIFSIINFVSAKSHKSANDLSFRILENFS